MRRDGYAVCLHGYDLVSYSHKKLSNTDILSKHIKALLIRLVPRHQPLGGRLSRINRLKGIEELFCLFFTHNASGSGTISPNNLTKGKNFESLLLEEKGDRVAVDEVFSKNHFSKKSTKFVSLRTVEDAGPYRIVQILKLVRKSIHGRSLIALQGDV